MLTEKWSYGTAIYFCRSLKWSESLLAYFLQVSLHSRLLVTGTSPQEVDQVVSALLRGVCLASER
jgi:hypothetical protein